ncbi:MAG TPA: trehalose-phosphatase [Terracidiphilus sp.]|nr:trehalose-phosphatase [Terracidiphilus sp.]
MNQIEIERLEEFFCSVATARTSLLLLDYDGTLADFRIDRSRARPWAGVRELLTKIQANDRTRLIVITGRPAGEINEMLKLDAPVEVWGLHGAERLLADGTRALETGSVEALTSLEGVRERLRGNSFGGLLEHKPNAVVMHWRGHSTRQAKAIEQKTRALFEPAAHLDGLSLLPFEAGIELRVGRDKGGAVNAIIEVEKPGSPVVYLGDDLTDEPAFCAVNRARSPHLSVLMRRTRRQTAANVWLRPPAELRWFLTQWLKATSASRETTDLAASGVFQS